MEPRPAATVEVPIIDVTGLRSDDPVARQAAADEVGRASREVGFMCIVGHGVPLELIDGILDATERIFALPLEEKMGAAWDADHVNRGYDPIGRQRLDSYSEADVKEAWSFGTVPFSADADPEVDVDQWPPLPEVRDVIETYFSAARRVAEMMMRGMALSLGLDEHHFEQFHRDPVSTLRLLHYPPRDPDADARTFGAGAHTDWGGVTVLLQDGSGSLEVMDKSGAWVAVPPVPGGFVINIGDLMERWTNGRYVSTLHRVLGADRDRYSVACFFDLDHDARIECLPTCCSEDDPPKYPPTTAGDHLMEKFTASMPSDS